MIDVGKLVICGMCGKAYGYFRTAAIVTRAELSGPSVKIVGEEVSNQ